VRGGQNTLPGIDMEKADAEDKMEALAGFLGIDPVRIAESVGSLYGYRAFYCDGDRAYLVLTEEEAVVAAEEAISERLWVIALETTFDYFGIDSYPSDVAAAMKSSDIARINEGLRRMIDASCGIDSLTSAMLSLGNRKNILADHNQREEQYNGYLIYRLF
jgi:hypothetical protein